MNITQPALRSFGKFLKLIVGGLITLCALFAIVRGFDYYVEQKIADLLQDENFLRKVSAKVRPSLIFDEKGSVLVDQGALESIDKIAVVGTGLPSRIVVTPKRYLSHAPLLQPLDPYVLDIKVSRGDGLNWDYDVSYAKVGGDDSFTTCKFRLEVLY